MARDMKILILSCLLVSLLEVNSETPSPLITEYRWKYFEYIWDTAARKKKYEKEKTYDPQAHFVPIDVDQSRDNRTFLTLVRGPGVPATLHTVTRVDGKSGPLLQPYPDWSWYNTEDQCSGIISVNRIAIDDCNGLWVLDTGLMNGTYICPMKLMVFDLTTDSLIFKQHLNYTIAFNEKTERGLLTNLIVETDDPQCEDVTVYIADSQGNALIVWRRYDGAIRLQFDRFYAPEPEHNSYSIAGQSFVLDYGLFGMALSPKRRNSNRYLMFRPMSSLSFYKAETTRLKTAVFGDKPYYDQFKDVLSSQASAQVFASDGTLFYGLISEVAIGCWNIFNPGKFKPILFDVERLQFVSGMKAKKYSKKRKNEYLLILTNKLQKILNNATRMDEYNFHILRAPVRELVRRCDKGSDKYVFDS